MGEDKCPPQRGREREKKRGGEKEGRAPIVMLNRNEP